MLMKFMSMLSIGTVSRSYFASQTAGPQLMQLISDINSFSASPDALKKLKDLQFVPRHEVKEGMQETVQCITAMLQHAGNGSVRNVPRYLFTVAKAAQSHPSLLAVLQKSPYREQMLCLLQTAAADRSMYKNSYSVSQLSVAQYTLGIFCADFWHGVPQNCTEKWSEQAASSFVYGYGKMRSMGAAPAAPDRLRELLVATVAWHAPKLTPQGVANTAWSLAKQGLHFSDVLLPLQEATRRTAPEMNAQEAANCVWAFATVNR